MNDFSYPEILAQWNISFRKIKPDQVIPGSPERSAFRIVVEAENNTSYILEAVEDYQHFRKSYIAETLERLYLAGLKKINPLLRTSSGSFHYYDQGFYWQLAPFLMGEILPRPDYLQDEWRGEQVAVFIGEMNSISLDLSLKGNTFFLKEFIQDLFARIRLNNSELLPRLELYLEYLHGHFFELEHMIPVCFTHGDIHPLNIIWGKQEIIAVIDWEFMGFKPEIFDLANLLGCLGMEYPRGLNQEFARNVISFLRQKGIYADESWHDLFDFVLASRFAWLSEWLRRNDPSMISLELKYMQILFKNKKQLSQNWF